jgi:hypothetical protein
MRVQSCEGIQAGHGIHDLGNCTLMDASRGTESNNNCQNQNHCANYSDRRAEVKDTHGSPQWIQLPWHGQRHCKPTDPRDKCGGTAHDTSEGGYETNDYGYINLQVPLPFPRA